MLIHLLEAAFLGFLQGITEFLPVSSTAHLAIAQRLFNLDPETYGLSFDMFTNLGTLAATIAFFWKDLKDIFGKLRLPFGAPLSAAEKLPWHILGASVPAGIVGFILQDYIERDFRTFPVMAASLVTVGLLMIFVEYRASKRPSAPSPEKRSATPLQIYGIGASQILALVPGVSRSGITISTGMFAGLDRVAAARASFLLSLPITGAATLYQLSKFGRTVAAEGIAADVAAFYMVGGLASLVTGYLTIRFLLDFYGKYSLTAFAIYRFFLAAVLGILIVTWQ